MLITRGGSLHGTTGIRVYPERIGRTPNEEAAIDNVVISGRTESVSFIHSQVDCPGDTGVFFFFLWSFWAMYSWFFIYACTCGRPGVLSFYYTWKEKSE